MLVLFSAGTLGGIFSTVVSIASLVSYPVLLALGVPPLSANMTNTVALVLTGAGSVLGSRPELAGRGRRVIRLGSITALGGVAGATVLLLAPASTFTVVVPVLIGASLVLLAQPRSKRLSPGADGSPLAPGAAQHAALLAVAVYLGYFGAAAGVMLPIVLSLMMAEPLAAGLLIGGWVGPKIVRKVPAGPLRVVVSLCGVGLAVRLGLAAY